MLARAQNAFGIARSNKNEALGVQAQSGKAGGVHRAGFGVQKILPDPEDRARPGGSQRQRSSKTRCSSKMSRRGRVDFLNAAPRKPAAKSCIDRNLPKRNRGSRDSRTALSEGVCSLWKRKNHIAAGVDVPILFYNTRPIRHVNTGNKTITLNPNGRGCEKVCVCSG